ARAMRLSGEVALVTGAGRRIGRAIALALAAEGAAVVVHHDTSKAEAAEVATAVKAGGGRAWTVRADLAKPKDRARLVADAAKAAGSPLTRLVNNASSFPQ